MHARRYISPLAGPPVRRRLRQHLPLRRPKAGSDGDQRGPAGSGARAGTSGQEGDGEAAVRMALPNKAWVPKVQSPRLRVVRFSGAALEEFVEEHELEKVTVRIYSAAKTVAD